MTDQRVPFPAALAHLKTVKGWVLWKWVEKKNKPGHFDKPPFQPRHPDRHASNINPEHWTDFRFAARARRNSDAAGVGFIVNASRAECWIDLDDCRDKESGEIEPWAARVVEKAGSYAEVTPSGKGIRVVGLLSGVLGKEPIHKPFKLKGNHRGEIYYRADRYVTVSGRTLPGSAEELAPIDEVVSAILKGDRKDNSEDTIPEETEDVMGLTSGDLQGSPNYSLDQIADYLSQLPPGDAKDEDGDPWWSYPKWMDVIFAVHDDTDGSEEGFAALDAWCQTYPEFYDPIGLREKWESVRGDKSRRRITMATVVWWVNEWTKPERDKKFEALMDEMHAVKTRVVLDSLIDRCRKLQLDSPLQRLSLISNFRSAVKRVNGVNISESAARKEIAYRNPDITDQPRWLRSFCWVSGIKKFHDSNTGQMYDPQAFDLSFGWRFLNKEEIAQGETTPPVSPTLTAINRYRVPIVAALGYLPSESTEDDLGLDDEEGSEEAREHDLPMRIVQPSTYKLNGIRYLNRYSTRGAVDARKGPWTKQEREDIKTILALYSRVCGSRRDRDILLSVYRKILLTRKRVSFCPVLASAERSGKTTACVAIPKLLFGPDNVAVYGPGILFDKSDQSWMDGSLIKVIEELYVPDYAKTAVVERLKPVITNEVISPRIMYEGTRNSVNTATYFALTNHRDILGITASDTRFYPIVPDGVSTRKQMDDLLAADPTFYHRVNTAIERSIGAFRGWLETEFQEHPDFNSPDGRAPQSEAKTRLVEEGRDPLETAILDILNEDAYPLLNREVVCTRTLMRVLAERNIPIPTGHGELRYQVKVVALALKRLDMTPRGRFRLPGVFLNGKGEDDDPLSDGPPDDRTRIWTNGVSALDSGPLSPHRLEMWHKSGGL